MPEVGRIERPETSIHLFAREERHHLPHFHATSKGMKASFSIETLEMLDGYLPPNAKRAVLRWAEHRQEELLAAWKDVHSGKKVDKIP